MSIELSAVTQSGYWRVKLAWPKRIPRHFGQFDTQAEAEKWIDEHRWLTEQREEPDAVEADDPDAPEDPEAPNDR